MRKIKNIIFDLGNVIIDLDMVRFDSKMKKLWTHHFPSIMDSKNEKDLFHRFETGNLTEEAFMWHWQNQYKTHVGKSYELLAPKTIMEVWNSMLVGIKPEIFDLLIGLKKDYKTLVFSNTNSMHIHWVDSYLNSTYGFRIVEFERKFFDKVYYSHMIRMRKPHVDGFLYIIDDADLVAEETLFIDDKLENIQGAALAGLQTLHLKPEMNLAYELNKLLA